LSLFSGADIGIVKFVQGVVQFSRGVFLLVPATSYHIISSDRYCYCFYLFFPGIFSYLL